MCNDQTLDQALYQTLALVWAHYLKKTRKNVRFKLIRSIVTFSKCTFYPIRKVFFSFLHSVKDEGKKQTLKK